MPALAPLLTTAQLQGYLDMGSLTPAEVTQLPELLDDASDVVRKFCRRAFTLATFDELYTVKQPSTTLILNQFPLATNPDTGTSIDRCCTNPTAVLTITQTNTVTNQRATVALQTTGDTVTGFVVTGLTLNRWASGVKTTVTLPIDGSDNLTIQALANAVNALNAGWQAIVNPGYALWASADLRAVQGATPAMGPNGGAELLIHVDDLTFNANETTGILELSMADAFDASSLRFGPPFIGEVEDAQTYGGINGVRVVYTAGFAAIPGKVRQITAALVWRAIGKFRTDPTLKSESDGVLSWSGRESVCFLSVDDQADLSPYVNHRA